MSTITVALNANWQEVTKNCVIFCNVTQAGCESQEVTIVGPYTDPNNKPTPRIINHGQMQSSEFGKQIGHFFDTVDYEQFQNYRYDLTFTHSGANPSNVVGTHGFQILDKAFGVVALANDSGSDKDYNDLVVTLTMFKQSTD